MIEIMKQILQEHFKPTLCEVIDDSAKHAGHAGAKQGGHYRLIITSDVFKGKSRLNRHRLVYDALAKWMQNGIHALQIEANDP